MATDEEIRAKDILPHKTAFSEGDGFYGDGDSSFFMEAPKLLELTAQNALAGNVVPVFNPTKPNDEGGYAYYKNEIVTHQGATYKFKVNHASGSWNAAEVERVIAGECLKFFVESRNPEYLYAVTDGNGAFLFGIKHDASVEWAVGVPQPVKDWVHTVLDVAMSGKVDKEYGKSLINSVFANGVEIVENDEYVYAVTDADDKFLFGVRKDGGFEWAKGIPYFLRQPIEEISATLLDKVNKVEGKSLIDAVFANGINIVQTKEFVYAVTDSTDKFLFGVKADGSFEWAKGIPETIQSVINDIIDSLRGKVDKQESKSLIDAGFAEKQSSSDNPEFSKVLLAASDEILEVIKKDGTRRFNNKVEFNNHLILKDPAYNDIEAALRAHGFAPKVPLDWSDSNSVKLPKPEMAIVNITGVDEMPQAKGTNAHAWIEFWDRNGNYFKKRVILDAQGSGSLQFPKKNFAFDLCNDEWVGDDTFKIKFGDWVEQDSFHGKAFWNDYFRGVANVGFDIYKDLQNSYGVENNRTWKQAQVFERYQNLVATGVNAYSEMYDRMDYGALCFPQGFPIIVYLNGIFYGLFTWNLKKHRDNYHMKKDVAEHIQIDPYSTKTLWNTDAYQNLDWTQIEIRNPKSLYCMDGTKYDGDHPKELIDNTSPYWNDSKNHKLSAKVKGYILDLRNNFKVAMNAMYPPPRDTATASAMMEEIFDIDNLLDYQLLMDWIQDPDGLDKNWQWTTWDGHKWYVNPYDLDTIMGNGNTGAFCRLPMEGMNIFSQYGPTWIAKELYMPRMKSRYAELRNAGVFDMAKLKEAVKSHYNKFTPDDWKAEWAKWNTCPLNIGLTINSDYWELQVDEYGMPLIERTASVPEYDPVTSYSSGDYVNIKQNSTQNWFYKFKAIVPSTGENPVTKWGQFDSFWRLCKWADLNKSLRDTQYNYNP